ncbi:MAG: ATP-binding protein [Alphaproteobacteria bacterium]|nr:ATP-binding protein [Alphaproteobacteria bacterium]
MSFGTIATALVSFRQLAELHGGALSLASAVGEGTSVTIRLPASRVGSRTAKVA